MSDTVIVAELGAMCDRPAKSMGNSVGIVDRSAIAEGFRRRREICEAQLDRFLAALRPLLVQNEAQAAWIFGSRARETAVPESDIDVMIVARTDRAFVDRGRDYMPALHEASVAVDMLIYTPEEFARMQAEERPFILEALKDAVPIRVER